MTTVCVYVYVFLRVFVPYVSLAAIPLPRGLPLRCALDAGMLPALERLLRRAGSKTTSPHAAVVAGMAAGGLLGSWLQLAISTGGGSSLGAGGVGLRQAAALVVTYGKLLRRAAAPMLAFIDSCCRMEIDEARAALRSAVATGLVTRDPNTGGGLVLYAQHLAATAAKLLRPWADSLIPERAAGVGSLLRWPQQQQQVDGAAGSQQQQQQQQQASAALLALAARHWYPTLAALGRRYWFVSLAVFLDEVALDQQDTRFRNAWLQLGDNYLKLKDKLGTGVVEAARAFRHAFAPAADFLFVYGPALDLLLPPSARASAAIAASPAASTAGRWQQAGGGGGGGDPAPASLIWYLQSCDLYTWTDGTPPPGSGGNRTDNVVEVTRELWHTYLIISDGGGAGERAGWVRRGAWSDGGWLALYSPVDAVDVVGCHVVYLATTSGVRDVPCVLGCRFVLGTSGPPDCVPVWHGSCMRVRYGLTGHAASRTRRLDRAAEWSTGRRTCPGRA